LKPTDVAQSCCCWRVASFELAKAVVGST
jgi:hypothetical protein